MKKIQVLILTVATLGLAMSSCNQDAGSKLTGNKKVELNNEIDSVSYALGLNVATQVTGMGVKDWNNDAFYKGFTDEMAGNELLLDQVAVGEVLETYFRKLQMQQMEEMQAGAEDNQRIGEEFLANNKNNSDVVETESGLQYQVIKMGDGPKPTATDNVKVHYHGTLINGTVFDSSVDRGEPVQFPLNGVIRGWTEGLQLMPVGSKFKFFIPGGLAYGSNPPMGSEIGANEVLIFEVELLEIN